MTTIIWLKRVQRHEFKELKIEWEKMRRERDEVGDVVKQLMESLNFQPKPYTRDQVHEDDLADDMSDDVKN
ncbi:unnamed protein product [Trifolium pratense]|uniref:Uncharacterized protein n=1 Tax=Trifolium pratense TaxID=57577 RepID=A0ACB0LCF8_TRIPR|nr:unnamed protein product [Trifolium pratense]